MPYRLRPGFTLIEIILVLAIVITLTSLAVPLLTGTLQNQRLRSSADTIRAEWMETRLKAMEEAQIFCFRCRLGTGEILVDRILDAHFTASLSSRDTTRRFDMDAEYDPFEQGSFTGDAEDFILRDPSQASAETGARSTTLPESVFVADLIVVPEERAAFYLGLTTPGESDIEDNASESEEVSRQEIRLGESTAADGTSWSAPVFFYPDGTTSAAALLLKNDRGRVIEVRLRGMTGIGKAAEMTSSDDYDGELDPTRERAMLDFDR